MNIVLGDNTAPTPQQFTRLTRILHWLSAVLVFTMLLVGFVMVNSLGDYATLVRFHKTLGVLVLAIVVVRIANRLTHRAPTLPATVGRLERLAVAVSEVALYALLLAQPLVGWAMVSTSGTPVILFGSFQLPAIAPVDAGLYSALRTTHSLLAYALVVIIAAHVCAVLLHSVTLRDGMLRRMTFRHGKSPATAPKS